MSEGGNIGGSANNTPPRLVANMPIPGAKDAPHFNGIAPSDFLKRIEVLAKNALIDSENEKVDFILAYSSDRIKSKIQDLPEFDIEQDNKTWIAAKEMLILLFGINDIKKSVTEQTLVDFCFKHAAEGKFRSETDVANYLLEFMAIAGPLVKNESITKKAADVKYIQGIPRDLQRWFLDKLPEANKKIDSPPSIKASHKILTELFDPASPFYQVDSSIKLLNRNYDEKGNRIVKITEGPLIHQASATSSPSIFDYSKSTDASSSTKAQKLAPNDEIEALTKAMQELKLNQALVIQEAIQNAMKQAYPFPQPSVASATSHIATPQAQPQTASRTQVPKCRGCGKTLGVDLDHRLGLRNCPPMIDLIKNGDIVEGTDQQGKPRLLMPNGAELPWVAPNAKGGISDLIRALKATTVPIREESSHMASSHPVGLVLNDKKILSNNNFAAYPMFVQEFSADPVTRTGKDTTNRQQPYNKQDDTKKPSPPAQPPKNNITPPPNPINREDGWKQSQPSKSQDVDMKDAPKKTNKPYNPYRITSDIQERTDINQLSQEVLNTKVTVSLKQLIGSSPALQKVFDDAFRTKRVYENAKPADTNVALWITADGEVHTHRSESETEFQSPDDLIIEDSSPDLLCQFLVKYTSKTQVLPSKKYMAMTCGFLRVEVNGKVLKAMADTGSKLNLAS